MGLLDKVKAQAEEVAAKAKEGVQEVQLKRELGQAYEELGKTTFGLADAGQVTHDSLTTLVAKIRDLRARLDEDAPAETPPAETQPTEPPAESGPPATPS